MPASVCELSAAEFGTLYYGCKGEIKGVLFNDGPEQAPFMAAVEMDGAQAGGRGGGGGGGDGEKSEKNYQPPFEVGVDLWLFWSASSRYADTNEGRAQR